jgi:hypothetical protein
MMSTVVPTAPVILSAEEIRAAERRWRRGVLESLDAVAIAEDLDYWSRQRALLLADLEARDFTDYDEQTLRNGVAYAECRLEELTRQAERHVRASRLPGYPRSRPPVDLGARFAAARNVDLVDLAQTLVGRPAVPTGNGRYRLCCPFHDGDRDPSLVIYPPGKGWHCFGCGRNGDAVSFVAELNQCSAVEALEFVEMLADTAPAASGVA